MATMVEVRDLEGLWDGEQFLPLSVWIEVAQLKVIGSPCYTKLEWLLGAPPSPTILNKPGSAQGGRVQWN